MKRFKIVIVLILLLSVFVLSGEEMNNSEKDLLGIDEMFASSVKKAGFCNAYLDILSKEGIVIPSIGYPVYGSENFKTMCRSIEDEFDKTSIKWKPEKVYVSKSGNFGYTIGKYIRKKKGDKKNINGFYASVWKKNKTGQWKLALSQGLFQFKIKNAKPDLNLKNELNIKEKELIEAELNFSNHSLLHGIPDAFYNFIAKEGIATGGSGPARTKDDYKKVVMSKKKNTDEKLEWKPVYSFLAASSEIGYNMGPFVYTVINKKGNKNMFKGYFFSIWIKENGKWKFIYDGGGNSLPDK